MNNNIKRNKFGVLFMNLFSLWLWYSLGDRLAYEWGFYRGTFTYSLIILLPMIVITRWIWFGTLKKIDK